MACHPVFFESETGFLSLNFFVRVFLGVCCCCLSSDSLQLFTLHLPFCKFFASSSRGFAFLFKVESFVCRGPIGCGVCCRCFSLGLFLESFSIFILFVVAGILCLSLCLFLSASLRLVEVVQTLYHVVFDVLDFSSEFLNYFSAEFLLLSWGRR